MESVGVLGFGVRSVPLDIDGIMLSFRGNRFPAKVIPVRSYVSSMAFAPSFWHPARTVSFEVWHRGRKVVFNFARPAYLEIDNKVRDVESDVYLTLTMDLG